MDSPNASQSPAGQETSSSQSTTTFVQLQQQLGNSTEPYAYQQKHDKFTHNDDYHLSQQPQHPQQQFVQQLPQHHRSNYQQPQQQQPYHRSLEDLAEIAQLSQQQHHYSQIQRQQQQTSYPISGKF